MSAMLAHPVVFFREGGVSRRWSPPVHTGQGAQLGHRRRELRTSCSHYSLDSMGLSHALPGLMSLSRLVCC